ncbi:hypothetical protein AMATHDRAFT_153265, partial [Amanita thiersii Skay4041]
AAVTMSRPMISSPLAAAAADASRASRATPLVTPQRPTHFQSSRALRPFPSIAHVLKQSNAKSAQSSVKLIEPPKNQKGTFLLDLTPAELSRQD